ncbi:hypothetical protein ABES80_03460 [Bacillus gobiensis]|uniref:hypothetical protein n=1 Tax=Bacillus gobiensis TaxID=1441095 RepID=UPI003D1DB5EE
MTDDKKLKELLSKAYRNKTFTERDRAAVFAKIKEREEEDMHTRSRKRPGSVWQHLVPVALTFVLLLGVGIFTFSSAKNLWFEQNQASPSIQQQGPNNENAQANEAEPKVDPNPNSDNEPNKVPDQEQRKEDTEKGTDSKQTEGYTSLEALLKDVETYLNTDIPFVKPTNLPKGEKTYYTAAYDNKPDGYSVIIYQTDHPVQINDRSLNNVGEDSQLVTLRGEKYESAEAAQQEVGYQEVQKQDHAIDLGYGLWGMQDAGAGHKFFNWNEGRWYLGMQAQTQNQIDLPGKAKEMVEFLENNTLPIPNQFARFSVAYENNDVTNSAFWQEGQIVYEVEPNTKDPVDALRIVTSITENR